MSEGALKLGGEDFSSVSDSTRDGAVAAANGARRGITPPAQPGGSTGFIDDVIVERGYADQGTVDWAVEQGRVHGQAVTAVLLDSRIVDEDQLSRAIAELHGLNHADLEAFDVDLDVARLISRQAGRRYKAVPIAFDSDGALIVALADPVDPLAVSDIAVMTRSEVRPMVATPSRIDALVEQLEDAPVIPPGFDAGSDRDAGDHTEDEDRLELLTPRDDELVGERDRLREELEAANRRAQSAQASLADLRAERDREREREQRAEREKELEAKLGQAKQANQRLEQRLATALEVAAEARAAYEKLVRAD